MALIQVVLKIKTPSSGPLENTAEYRLSRSGFETHFDKVLQESTVNGKILLEEYLNLLLTQNKQELNKIIKFYKNTGANATGRTIKQLSFYFETNQEVTIHDAEDILIEGYYKKVFEPLLIKEGFKDLHVPLQHINQEKKIIFSQNINEENQTSTIDIELNKRK